MTEQLLTQQLESPSGTGRVEPRSPQPAPHPSTEMGCSLWTNPFSLGILGGHVASIDEAGSPRIVRSVLGLPSSTRSCSASGE